MLVLLHFADPTGSLAELLQAALQALGSAPGMTSGIVARCPDLPERWLLAVQWQDVGSMRRGMGSYAAKLALGPLQQYMLTEPGAFEVLAEQQGPDQRVTPSDLVPDAGRMSPGRQR